MTNNTSNGDTNVKARTKVIAYIILTIIISSIPTYLWINSKNDIYAALLMWSPALAGIITLLIFDRSLRSVGWKPGKFKYLAAALLIPLAYWLIIYGLIWILGWGEFLGFSLFGSLLMMAIPSVLTSAILALGEEIGWRGVLVPNLSRVTTFTAMALISGVIWALWHYPLIISGLYANDTNLIFQLFCFTIAAIGVATMLAWFRLRSGSIWPAVLYHAVHNTLIDSVFSDATITNDITPYMGTEFGIGLALTGIVLFIIFWSKRNVLEGKDAMRIDAIGEVELASAPTD